MNRLKRQAQFLEQAFPDSGEHYHSQWISRFARGTEWAYADTRSRSILMHIDPQFYPKDVNHVHHLMEQHEREHLAASFAEMLEVFAEYGKQYTLDPPNNNLTENVEEAGRLKRACETYLIIGRI